MLLKAKAGVILEILLSTFLSRLSQSQLDDGCGEATCFGVKPFCCTAGITPRCVVNEKNCAAITVCGSQICSSLKPYCCKSGPNSFCTYSNESCTANICGKTSCSLVKPYCCKVSNEPYCSVSKKSCVPRKLCGNDLCPSTRFSCCGSGEYAFCVRDKDKCPTHVCGNLVCPFKLPFCCRLTQSTHCTANELICILLQTKPVTEPLIIKNLTTTSIPATKVTKQHLCRNVNSKNAFETSTFAVSNTRTTTVTEAGAVSMLSSSFHQRGNKHSKADNLAGRDEGQPTSFLSNFVETSADLLTKNKSLHDNDEQLSKSQTITTLNCNEAKTPSSVNTRHHSPGRIISTLVNLASLSPLPSRTSTMPTKREQESVSTKNHTLTRSPNATDKKKSNSCVKNSISKNATERIYFETATENFIRKTTKVLIREKEAWTKEHEVLNVQTNSKCCERNQSNKCKVPCSRKAELKISFWIPVVLSLLAATCFCFVVIHRVPECRKKMLGARKYISTFRRNRKIFTTEEKV